MPKAKKDSKPKTLREKADAVKSKAKKAFRKVVPAPEKSNGKRGAPNVGSGMAERGKSAVIRGSRRTEDELKKMGQ